MDLVGTLGKMILNGAMNRGSGGGGLGSLLGAAVQGQQGGGGAGGLGDLLGSLAGGQSGGGAGGLGELLGQLQKGGGGAGGLGDLLGKLQQGGGGGNAGGGIGDLLGQLAGAAGQSGGNTGGGLLGSLLGGAQASGGQKSGGGLGDLLGAALGSQLPTAAPAPAPSAEQSGQAEILIRAMINSAKSDGGVDQEEQEKIVGKMGEIGEAEAQFIRSEMQAPLDVDAFVRSVPRGMEQQVYLMSLMAINLDSREEAQYLDQLAKGMGISEQVSNQLHTEVGAPVLYS